MPTTSGGDAKALVDQLCLSPLHKPGLHPCSSPLNVTETQNTHQTPASSLLCIGKLIRLTRGVKLIKVLDRRQL